MSIHKSFLATLFLAGVLAVSCAKEPQDPQTDNSQQQVQVDPQDSQDPKVEPAETAEAQSEPQVQEEKMVDATLNAGVEEPARLTRVFSDGNTMKWNASAFL